MGFWPYAVLICRLFPLAPLRNQLPVGPLKEHLVLPRIICSLSNHTFSLDHYEAHTWQEQYIQLLLKVGWQETLTLSDHSSLFTQQQPMLTRFEFPTLDLILLSR